MTTRFYTQKNGTINYDASLSCLIASVSGFMPSKEFRSYLEYGLELIREKMKNHEQLSWIIDVSNADVFEPEDTRWIIENWQPRIRATGIKNLAFIMPENVFADINVDNFVEQIGRIEDDTITIAQFRNVEQAKEWLMNTAS